MAESLVVIAIADGSDVVDESVVPDVEDVLLVPRDAHTPVDRRPRDRDVLQTAFDEAEGLVASHSREDRVGVLLVPLEQTILETAQLEEPVLLREPLDGAFVDGAEVALEQI